MDKNIWKPLNIIHLDVYNLFNHFDDVVIYAKGDNAMRYNGNIIRNVFNSLVRPKDKFRYFWDYLRQHSTLILLQLFLNELRQFLRKGLIQS